MLTKKNQKSKLMNFCYFYGESECDVKIEFAHDLAKTLGPIYSPKDLKKDFLLKLIYFGLRFDIKI